MRVKKLFNQVLKNGGCTIGLKYKSGFMVSLRDCEKVIKINFKLFKQTMKEYKRLKKQFNDVFIGLWVENNRIFFDISKHYNLKGQALFYGEINKQKAVYDIANNCSIYL